VLILASTSDKVQVVTAQAVNVDVHASWMDYDSSVSPATDRVTPGRKNSKISTATTTDVVTSPGSATIVRNVKTITIANIHASSSVGVTLQHTDGTNVILIENVTLLAGERMSWREGVGMRVIDASGLEKVNPMAQGQYTVARLAATVTNSTTTAAKVTGLDLVCGPGTWIFEYFLRAQSATVTVSPRLSVNHSGTVTTFLATLTALTTDVTGTGFAWDQDVVIPTVMSGMAQRAKSAGALMGHTVTTNAVDTINSDILIQISGLLVCTVGGNMELWHASETATATSIMLDSSLRLTKMG
jgi:hypothetical protein